MKPSYGGLCSAWKHRLDYLLLGGLALLSLVAAILCRFSYCNWWKIEELKVAHEDFYAIKEDVRNARSRLSALEGVRKSVVSVEDEQVKNEVVEDLLETLEELERDDLD